jgi:anti-anti-sigma factor
VETAREDAIALSGHLDGRCTAELREALYSHIAAHPDEDVLVDVSGVESLDMTALQLLVTVALRVEQAGRHLVLRGCSPALRRILAVRRWRRLFWLERECSGGSDVEVGEQPTSL